MDKVVFGCFDLLLVLMWLSVYFRISFDIKYGVFLNNFVELKRLVEFVFSIFKVWCIFISENIVFNMMLNLLISVISCVWFLFFYFNVD